MPRFGFGTRWFGFDGPGIGYYEKCHEIDDDGYPLHEKEAWLPLPDDLVGEALDQWIALVDQNKTNRFYLIRKALPEALDSWSGGSLEKFREPAFESGSLDFEEAVKLVVENERANQALQDELDAWELRHAEERKRAKAKSNEKAARIAAERKRMAEEKRLARIAEAEVIHFEADEPAVVNLYERLAIVSQVDVDSIRLVEAIDRRHTNGYMFGSNWVNDRSIEVYPHQVGVYLVASRRCQYKVLVLQEGRIRVVDALTLDTKDKGWALILREGIEALMAEVYANVEQMLTFTVPLSAVQEMRRLIASEDEIVEVPRELLCKFVKQETEQEGLAI